MNFKIQKLKIEFLGTKGLFGVTPYLTLAFHEHKHHPFIHEHEHMKFHFILYTLSHVMLIIYMHMLVIMYDQCMKWLWGHENTLDTSWMVNGTMFIFMT